MGQLTMFTICGTYAHYVIMRATFRFCLSSFNCKFVKQETTIRSYIIPCHKLGLSLVLRSQILESQRVVAILNYSKITCTFPDDG